ncbi:MAG: hypothetical protein JSU96_05135, partial [Acidobacteriota bacterium]
MGLANFARMLLLGVVVTFGCSLLFAVGPAVPASESAVPVHIEINAAAHIRTIPETLYGANLTAWDGQTGSNARFNNLIIASGRTEMRWPGGSWGDAFLWSDMEGPSGRNRWIVSYPETLNLLSKLGGRLQPIVNFPGFWHEIDHSHEEAVAAAVAWAQDQMARTPGALYWEIGNEIMGPWEAGWEEGVISGTYYGNHFADFYRAMKEVNPMIRIGAVADPVDGPDWWNPGLWTRDMLTAAFQQGIVPDFLIIHAYPGSNRHSDYNPYLFSHNIEEIAIFTQDLNQIISEALGPEFSGTIPFWMTEYRAGGIEYSSDDQNRNEATEIYPRWQLFSGALFLSQYILEMATHGWEGSNSFGEFFFTRRGALPAWHPYLGDYEPVPDWYVYPFLTQRFGRNLVLTRDNHPLVRAYAALDAEGSLTIFAANNSPDQTLKADVEVSGMVPTTTGQRWLLQGAGQTMTGATSPPQDLNDLSVNGVVHPDPLSVGSTPGSTFTAGPSFQIELPPSSILFATVPAASGVAPDAVPPSPEGAEWKVKPHPIGDDSISMEAAEASDPSGVEYSFICVEGGGHDSGWQEGPLYTDHGLKTGTLYRYVVATRDRSPNRNQSPQSDTASATPVPVGIPIEVENAGFEQPGTDPQDSWTTIPGWQSEGDQTDAVIEQIFPTEGTWNARLNGLSAPVWNLTNHLIQAGSVVQLTFSARDYWSGSTRFRASLFYDKDGVRQPIVSREFTLVREARTYKVSFASSDQPQAIGHRLGIEFANLRQGSAAVDDVRLSSAGEFQVQFPHFASGLGLLSSEIYLQNPNPSLPVNTWLDFRADDGSPIEVELNGLSPAGESLVSLPAGGMSVLRSPASSPLLTGSVTSHSDQPLSGVLLFGGGTGLAGVAGKEDFSDRFRAPVEVRQSLQVNTGLALMNPTVLESRVDLKLAGTDGIPVAQAEVILPARGHRALFVTELQWVPAVSFEDFDGLLMINSYVPVAA